MMKIKKTKKGYCCQIDNEYVFMYKNSERIRKKVMELLEILTLEDK